MYSLIKRILNHCVIFSVLLVLAACGDLKVSQSLTQPSDSLAVIPTNLRVVVSDTVTFGAIGGAKPYTFAIKSGDGSIDATTGLFQAPAATGTTVVTMTDSAGNTVEATVTIVSAGTQVAPTVLFTSPANNSTLKDQVTVTGICRTGVTVNFSGAGLASSSTAPCVSGAFSSTLTFSNGEGSKAISAQQTDASGTGSDNVTFVSDLTPPSATSVAINGGAPATNLAIVTLNLAATGASDMYVTSTAGCASGGTWESFVATRLWTLSSLNAANTVYAKFRDAVGNESSCLSATIVHDNIAPTLTILTPTPTTRVQPGLTLTGACETGLSVNISGDVSSNSTVTCSAGTYSQALSFSAGATLKTIQVSSTDAAGNLTQTSQTYLWPDTLVLAPTTANLITNAQLQLLASGGVTPYTYSISSGSGSVSVGGLYTAPNGASTEIVQVTDALGSTATASINVTVGGSPVAPLVYFTSPLNNTVVKNSVVVTGACRTGVNVDISGSGVSSAGSVSCTSGTFATTLTLSAGEGAKAIVASQTDAGQTGTANLSVTSDLTAPTGTSIAINAGASYTKNSDVILTLAATGAAEMYITSVSGCASGSAWETFVTSKPWTLTTLNAANTIYAKFRDAVGNESSCISASITHDNVAPVLTITAPVASTRVQTGLTLTGACETGLTVNISGDVTSASTATCSGGNFSAALNFSAGATSKNIIVTEADLAGNMTQVSQSYLQPDALTLTPSGLSLTTSSTVQMTAAGGISPYTYSMQSGSGSISGTGLYTAPASASSDVVLVTDALGGTVTATITVVSAGTLVAPVLYFSTPADNSHAAGSVTITGVCQDGLSITLGGAGLGTPSSTTCSSGAFSQAITLSGADGSKVITVSQTNASGTTTATRTFVKDTTAPTGNSITIDSGALATNSLSAQLALASTGASEMLITNNSDCATGGTWETFAALKSWTLPSANASNTVYAKFRDDVGNTSTCVSASITHDNVAPALAVTAPTSGAMVGGSMTVTGTCETGLPVSLSGGVATATSLTCTAGAFSQSVSFSAGDGGKVLQFSQVDAAGNSSQVLVPIVVDTTAPTGNSIAINNNAAKTNSTAVTLTLTSQDATQMYITDTAACASGGTWETFNPTKAWTLSATNTTVSVYAKFRDAVGNQSACVSAAIIHSDQAPVITFSSPSAGATVNGTAIIQGSCQNGLPVQIGGAGLLGPSSTACTGTFSQTITFTSGTGSKVITVSQADSFGNTGSDTRTFNNATGGPTGTSLAINGGAAATTSTSVTLTLSATSAVDMYITNTSSCASGGSWESFATTKAWTLGQSNATATVYAKFRDSGLVESGCVSATIVHDNIAPTVNIASPVNGANVGGSVTLSGNCETGLTVNLSGSGLSVPSTATCSAGAFSQAVNFTEGSGSKAVQVSQTDLAGNTGNFSVSYNVSNTPPTGTSLLIAGGASYTNSTTVTLTLAATNATDMYITNTAGCSAGGTWQTFATSQTWSLGQTNTLATVYAKFRDSVGNESSCINATITHDNVAPAIAITSPAANTMAQSNISLAGTCETGLTVTISGSGVLAPVTTPCSAGSFSQLVDMSATDGNKNFQVSQTDAAGNIGQDARIFVRKNTAPTSNSIAINGGTTYTNSTAVTLTLGSTGATQMYITNNPGCSSGGTWETYNTSKAWSLGQTNGVATVYAAFQDSVGNQSSCISATITHDNVAPVLTFTSPAANTQDPNGVTISGTCETGLTVTIAGSGASSSTTTTCTSSAFTAPVVFSTSQGTKTISISQTDAAGNIGSTTRDFVKASATPSGATSLIVASSSIVPSDNSAEVTVFVTVQDNYGALGGSSEVVEISVTPTTGITFTGTAGACRSASAGCSKASYVGSGTYSIRMKSSSTGAYTFSGVIAGTPDRTLTTTAAVTFDTSQFVAVTAGSTIDNTATYLNKNLYFTTAGTYTFGASSEGQTYKTIYANGTSGVILTHTAGSSGTVRSLKINADALVMMGGATINADGKGYIAGQSFPATASLISLNSAGSSHGGRGSWRTNATDPGPTYDSYSNPVLPGAGGLTAGQGGGVVIINSAGPCVLNGTTTISASATTSGGSGPAGGTINLRCSMLGGNSTGTSSVVLKANGGNSTSSVGAGGGGRIALVASGGRNTLNGIFTYPTDATSLTAFRAATQAYGGRVTASSTGEAGAGTIYLKHSGLNYGALLVDNGYTSGQGMNNQGYTHMVSIAGTLSSAPGVTTLPMNVTSSPALSSSDYANIYAGLKVRPNVAYTNGTPSDWTDDSLVTVASNTQTSITTVENISNAGSGNTFRSIELLDAMEVVGSAIVTSYGDIYALGTLSNPGVKNVTYATDSWIDFAGGAQGTFVPQAVTFAGTGATLLGPVSGTTFTVSSASPAANMVVPSITTTGDVTLNGGTVSTNSVVASAGSLVLNGSAILTSPATTTTVESKLNIQLGGNLLMNSTSKIDVSGKGYPVGYTYSSTGPSTTLASVTNAGGSHGGWGSYGAGAASNVGPTYGNYRDPQTLGSGSGNASGGAGGGAVKVSATGSCTLNTSAAIKADAKSATYGGAGGSVSLYCASFGGTTGASAITANGATSSGSIYAGGGGRIAMVSSGDVTSFSGSFAYPNTSGLMTSFKANVLAAGGAWANTSPNTEGGAGSVYLKHSGLQYGAMIINNNQSTPNSGQSAGQTMLVSMAGSISGSYSGKNLPVTSTSSPTLSASYTNMYAGMMLRPDLSFTNGTTSDWSDDNVLTVASNNGTSFTTTNNITGSIANGASFRSIDIFDNLEVIGGARIITNGDIYVLNGGVSNPGSNQNIVASGSMIAYNGSANSNGILYDVTTPAGSYTYSSLSGKSITIPSGSSVTVNGPLTSNTTVTVNGGSLTVNTGCITAVGTVWFKASSVVKADCVSGGDYQQDSSTSITVNTFTMTGNASINGGTLSHYTGTSTQVYRLTMNIAGTFTMSAGSIALSGIGYPVGYKYGPNGTPIAQSGVNPSHGGAGSTSSECYDDFKNPVWAGSAGTTSAGGGAFVLTAGGNCTVNSGASISANGIDGNAAGWVGLGAGGSINMTCAGFAGTAGANSLSAYGGLNIAFGAANGVNYGMGGGGRIALISTNGQSSFTGSFTWPTSQSTYNSLKSILNPSRAQSPSPGAGTIFLKHSGLQYGALIVDNAGTTMGYETYLPSFSGTISSVSGSTINLNITSTKPTLTSNNLGLLVGTQLRPDITFTNGTPNDWTDDNVITVTGNTTTSITTSNSTAGITPGTTFRTITLLDYLDVQNGGLLTSSGDIYVKSGSLINPSTTLQYLNGGFLSVVGNFNLSLGDITLSSGSINLTSPINVRSLTLSGSTVSVPSITTSNDLTISSGTLTTNSMTVGGNYNMSGGTVYHYSGTSTQANRLLMNVTGTFTMSAGSFALSSLGYPVGYKYGPNGTPIAQSGVNPSHGGAGSTASECYDDFKNPVWAGSAGTSSAGGGAFVLTAGGLCTINSGASISANGGDGNAAGFVSLGAGGSINMTCAGFTGTAGASALTAYGGLNVASGAANAINWGMGGGGRIALISTNGQSSFTGSFAWPTNQTSYNSLKSVLLPSRGPSPSPGAGTIFLKHSGLQYGALIVDNIGNTMNLETFLPSISGTITSVSGNTLTLNITSTKPTFTANNAGLLVGTQLRPDITFTNGTPNDWTDDNVITVTGNTATTITTGNSTAGITPGTTFRTITLLDYLDVQNGGLLTSNGDIYVKSGSLINPSTTQQYLNGGFVSISGNLNLTFGDVTLSSGTLTLSNPVTMNSFTNSGTTLTVPSMTLTSNYTQTGGTTTVNNLTVGGNLTMSAGTLTHQTSTTSTVYKLIANISGTLSLSGTAAISATAIGYPTGYSYGPSGPSTVLASGAGTHGGIGGSSTTPTYGDLRNPMLPGSGGTTGAGGGVINLNVTSTCSLAGSSSIVSSGTSNGAGGSINLICGGFNGTGTSFGITANGAGAGGGGRIALVSTGNAASFGGTLAYPSDSTSLTNFKSVVKAGSVSGGAGTIYLKHSSQNWGSLIVDNLTNFTTNATHLPSLAGTLTSAPSGTNLPVTVTSTPALTANHVNMYVGMRVRPSLVLNNGTPSDLTDDTIRTVTANSASALTLDSSVAGASSGDLFRTIDIFDNIDVANGALLQSNGDIYVVNGPLSNPGSANPIDLSNSWINMNAPASINAGLGAVSVTGARTFSSGISASSLTLNYSGGTLTIPSITTTQGLTISSGTVSVTGNTVVGTDFNQSGTAATTFNGSFSAGNDFLLTGTGTVTAYGNMSIGRDMTLSGGTATTPASGARLNANNVAITRNLTVSVGSVLSHPATTTTTLYRLWGTIGGYTYLKDAGAIDVSARGYTSGYSYGLNGTPSNASQVIGATAAAGASHGGRGGSVAAGVSGIIYDNYADPQLPGAGANGGVGGGVAHLTTTGTCQFDNLAKVNANASANYGAGGSIYLKCGSFSVNTTSSPTFTATGGAASAGSGGGGGRISLISTGNDLTFAGTASFAYPLGSTNLTNFKTKVQALGGAGVSTTYPEGGAGTIYTKHSALTYGDVIVDNGNSGSAWINTTYSGKTEFLSATDNTSKLFSRISTTAAQVASAGLTYTNRNDLYKNASIYIFPVSGGNVNPLDASNTIVSLSGNNDTQFLTASSYFPAINNDYYYRFVTVLDRLDVGGKATLDMANSSLVLANSAACDLHSATATSYDVPVNSFIKNGFAFASAYCKDSGVTTKATTVNFTNYNLAP